MERLEETPPTLPGETPQPERGAQERVRRDIDHHHDDHPQPEADGQVLGRDVPPADADGRTLNSPWLGGG